MKLECKRCNHNWIPRIEKPPVKCPHCKSPYWNKDRTREIKKKSAYSDFTEADKQHLMSIDNVPKPVKSIEPAADTNKAGTFFEPFFEPGNIKSRNDIEVMKGNHHTFTVRINGLVYFTLYQAFKESKDKESIEKNVPKFPDDYTPDAAFENAILHLEDQIFELKRRKKK